MNPTDYTAEIRKALREGNRDRFHAGLEWASENLDRPPIPSAYERAITETPRHGADWSVWRCPECGTENAGPECGFCKRVAEVEERYD